MHRTAKKKNAAGAFERISPRPTPVRKVGGRVPVTLFSLVVPWLVLGCHAPAQPTGPTEIELDVPDRDAFFEASLSVLRRNDFPPAFADQDSGLIITEPATSAQWFEVWRTDSRGAYQTLEASMHTMRRAVTVNLEPVVAGDDANATRCRLRVQVDKSRYSAPERQVTTASGALGLYSRQMPTTEGRRGAQSADAQWVPLGRDALLEEYLLKQLVVALPPAALSEL